MGFSIKISLPLLLIFLASSFQTPPASAQQPLILIDFKREMQYFDPFYQEPVIAYTAGSTGNLEVVLMNAFFINPINVSEVSVRFSWMEDNDFFFASECTKGNPCSIEFRDLITVDVNFTVPKTSGLNVKTHQYELKVVSSGGLDEDVPTRIVGPGIAVYSETQAMAVDIYERLAELIDLNSFAVFTVYRANPPSPFFTTSEGNLLVQNSRFQVVEGLAEYRAGHFEEARDIFQSALDMVERAYDIEAEKGVTLQDAAQAQASAEEKQAEALGAQGSALTEQAEALSEQAVAFNLQAEAQKAQAEALIRQADAFSGQSDAMARQAESLSEQSAALERQAAATEALAASTREQAAAMMVQAIGLTIGVVLIGLGVIVYVLKRENQRK